MTKEVLNPPTPKVVLEPNDPPATIEDFVTATEAALPHLTDGNIVLVETTGENVNVTSVTDSGFDATKD